MSEKVVLNDGTELEIENGASESSVTIMLEQIEQLKERWDVLSEKNLEKFVFLNSAGLECSTKENKVTANAIVTPVGESYRVEFILKDVDMIAKRLRALEEGQELQDGAIIELAELAGNLNQEGV